MFDSVLSNGNKWLLDGGLMFKDMVTPYWSAIDDLDYQTKNEELFDMGSNRAKYFLLSIVKAVRAFGSLSISD